MKFTYKYQEAINYSDIGIKLAININSLYLLGELYFEKGSNILKIKSQEEGLNYIKKALFIFEMTEKNENVEIIKKHYLQNNI